MPFDSDTTPPGARIKVIGVGGGGSNAVNTMIRSGLDGVEFLSANTDVQSLRFSLAPTKLQLGKELTRGLGAGADPDIGRDAALEDRHEIQEYLQGADMVFITAGMGGGTGTGGASVVAQIARELGALTVAVVTKPFAFEGKRRKRHSEAGINRLRECVDTLITIPNQRLLTLASPDLAMVDAFKMADAVLVNAVKGISEIINTPGVVNVDFADVKAVMSCMGQALMGIGIASGEKRALEAARQAIRSPLLEDVDIEGATGILINIAAGADVKMMEINEACMLVQDAAHEDANIIFGAVIDESLGDQIRVTVIATGFPADSSDEDFSDSTKNQSSPLTTTYSSRLNSSSYGGSLIKPNTRSTLTSNHYSAPVARKSHEASISKPTQVRTSETISEYDIKPKANTQPTIQDGISSFVTPIATEIQSHKHETGTNLQSEINVAQNRFDNAKSQINNAAAESATLAQITLNSSTSNNTVDCLSDFPSLEADNATASDSRIEGARVIDDPKDEMLVPVQIQEKQVIGASIFDIAEPKELETSDSNNDDLSVTAINPPLDELFGNDPHMIAGDIDRKIDEALELAQRLKGPEIKRDEDDLDVPAFIRNNLGDLSLS